MFNNSQKYSKGFTIVELLVVIVVIGILAAITIVSYTGITQKAAAATLESDLRNSSTQLGLDNASSGSYPSSEGAANNGKGLPKSPGTSYQYTVTSIDYCLSAISGTQAYHISSIVGTVEDGVCAGHIPPGGTPMTSGWKQIANGASHTCAISYNDKVYCWGKSNFGQVGYGSTTNKLVPIQVTSTGVLSGLTIKAIALNKDSDHTCAIASDNLAYCWGSNFNGMLGNNSTTQSTVPVRVDMTGVLAGKTIKSITIHTNNSCAIASDNLPYCWGYNTDGELGNNSTTRSLVPVAVDMTGAMSGKTVKTLYMGMYGGVCVIASDDLPYCWGDNSNGRQGNNSTTRSLVPVAVDMTGAMSGKTVKKLVMSYPETCAITSDDKAYCWGYNASGQLGNNSTTELHAPVAVDISGVLAGKTIKDITIEDSSVCALASDNQVYCWGYNGMGRLGNNSTVNSWVPVAVYTGGALNGKTISAITSGYETYCAIDTNNAAYCWGWNNYGQLGGNIGAVNSQVPVAVDITGVLSGKTVNSIIMSNYHVCAIASDNRAVCFGYGTSGQLGNNAILNSSIPVAVPQPL